MALTGFQKELIALISQNRKVGGESYVAGGAALNTLLDTTRLSRDIDLFHDSRDSVHRAAEADLKLISDHTFEIEIEIDRDTFVEAVIRKGPGECRIQWTQDSAFRFFPLMDHPVLGLTLHPFDLATNKVLALVGRAEPRDWVDAIACNNQLQHLGYLAWAAAGKDPGLNPEMILSQAARSSRYNESELAEVEFEGTRPSAVALAREWRNILQSAHEIVATLPAAECGKCVLNASKALMNLDARGLVSEIERGTVRFHSGTLRGAFPMFI